jgi:rubrerythrin
VHDLTGFRADASRRGFLRASAAPIAAGGLAAFLAACGSSSDPQTAEDKSSDAQAPTGGADKQIVNYALTLEHIEVDFYDRAVGSGALSGAEADLFKRIQENEHAHVDALVALAKKLHGDPVAEKPDTQFPIGGDRGRILSLAAQIEGIGAAAYLGQMELIENREVLAAAVSIHSIEARHAAKLALLAGDDFSPDGAFATPQNMEEVHDAIQPFLV